MTFVRRSATTDGVVSERPSRTLMRPLFSATKIRPSGANWSTVGFTNPDQATLSVKLAGTVPAATGVTNGALGSAAMATSMAITVDHRRRSRLALARPDARPRRAVIRTWLTLSPPSPLDPSAALAGPHPPRQGRDTNTRFGGDGMTSPGLAAGSGAGAFLFLHPADGREVVVRENDVARAH